MSQESEEKIAQLQFLEQNLQGLLSQKQMFQSQLMETDNAIGELGSSKGDAYKFIGSILVLSDKTELQKELKERKEIIDLRLKAIEKQEGSLRKKAEALQKEIMEILKGEK